MIYLSKIMDFPWETTIETMILGQDFVKCGSGKLGIPGHCVSTPLFRSFFCQAFFAQHLYSFWKVNESRHPFTLYGN